MNRKRFFSKPLTFLIVAVLAVTVFSTGSLRIWLTAGAFIVAGAWVCLPFALRLIKKIKLPKAKKPVRKFKVKRLPNTATSEARRIPSVSDSTPVVLLRHVNHRITNHLKSASPDAAWEWVSERPEAVISKGGTGRIRLFNVPDYNYADVTFDQMANIKCDFLRLVPLAEFKAAQASSAPETTQTGQPVDPAVWYNIQGKALLEACIADLRSHGFSALTIKENGDVCVRKANQDVTCANLKFFPDKTLWPGLAEVMKGNHLKTAVLDTGISVSW